MYASEVLVSGQMTFSVAGLEKWTPVHQAVEMGDFEALAVFMDAGADPNEMCFGLTLLTHAIDLEGDSHLQSGHPLNTAATAILLAYGADPRLPTADGETPLQVAHSYGHEPAQRLLERFLSSGTGLGAQGEEGGRHETA
ncbi:ankyrin repeat domain-containing protein [Streptomyces sp. NPDC087903]|uniref:ankyrin repeat domain-containing protein n=1 Tax=Streptomyces sp. NPDC087903 TaxID=3365819 RepID=UPI0038049D1F